MGWLFHENLPVTSSGTCFKLNYHLDLFGIGFTLFIKQVSTSWPLTCSFPNIPPFTHVIHHGNMTDIVDNVPPETQQWTTVVLEDGLDLPFPSSMYCINCTVHGTVHYRPIIQP